MFVDELEFIQRWLQHSSLFVAQRDLDGFSDFWRQLLQFLEASSAAWDAKQRELTNGLPR